jgi:hypothetical protein
MVALLVDSMDTSMAAYSVSSLAAETDGCLAEQMVFERVETMVV